MFGRHSLFTSSENKWSLCIGEKYFIRHCHETMEHSSNNWQHKDEIDLASWRGKSIGNILTETLCIRKNPNEQTNNRRDERNKNHLLLLLYTKERRRERERKTSVLLHTHKHMMDLVILLFSKHRWFRMCRWVYDRYYRASHSHPESYPYDGHCRAHYLARVSDVGWHLGARAMDDVQCDVQQNGNECDLEMIGQWQSSRSVFDRIHTSFVFTTATTATIYRTEDGYDHQQSSILPRDLERRFRSREFDRRRSSTPTARLPPGWPPRRVEPRPPPTRQRERTMKNIQGDEALSWRLPNRLGRHSLTVRPRSTSTTTRRPSILRPSARLYAAESEVLTVNVTKAHRRVDHDLLSCVCFFSYHDRLTLMANLMQRLLNTVDFPRKKGWEGKMSEMCPSTGKTGLQNERKSCQCRGQ